jgi:hypothetical protein
MRHSVLVMTAACATLALSAARAQIAVEFTPIENAVETPASLVTLPSGPGSTLLMATCARCARKPFPATSATTYWVADRQVTPGELQAAVQAQPHAFLTVCYSVATGQLTRITADLVPPPR